MCQASFSANVNYMQINSYVSGGTLIMHFTQQVNLTFYFHQESLYMLAGPIKFNNLTRM